MGYVRVFDILPEELVRLIQTYVEGELIYIPKQNKKAWGANTETRKILKKRNSDLYADYLQGVSIPDIAKKYFLTEKSVKRIIRQVNLK